MKIILAIAFCLLAGAVEAAPYYNSSEAGCDGTDTNVVFCDDFEDGVWYATNCDNGGGTGRTQAANDGWCGTIDAEPITPANAILCGAGVTPFGDCAGNGGAQTSGGGRNMAQRYIKTSGCGTDASQRCPVETLYVRWYAKWASGYQWNQSKHMNITTGDNDIAFANVQLDCGGGSRTSTASVSIQVLYSPEWPEGVCYDTGVSVVPDKWYFMELRITAHATAGRIQFWFNDCGSDGTSCGASPTLRLDETLGLPGNGVGDQIETIWPENWSSNDAGTGPYWDQMKASIVGPIGFSGEAAAEPSAKTYYRIGGMTMLAAMVWTLVSWWRRRRAWGFAC